MTTASQNAPRSGAVGAATVAVAGVVTAAEAPFVQVPCHVNIKDGKRVPKPTSRITNADGSWREETRQGNCVQIKESTPDGTVKTTRKCD